MGGQEAGLSTAFLLLRIQVSASCCVCAAAYAYACAAVLDLLHVTAHVATAAHLSMHCTAQHCCELQR